MAHTASVNATHAQASGLGLFVQDFDDAPGLGVGDAVVDGLGGATGGEQALAAHHRQVLRQGGLGQADGFGQGADGHFAVDQEMTHYQQAAFVGQQAQQLRRLGDAFFEHLGAAGGHHDHGVDPM